MNDRFSGAVVAAGLAMAGVGMAVWASIAEDDEPGWRSTAATVLVAASVVTLVSLPFTT